MHDCETEPQPVFPPLVNQLSVSSNEYILDEISFIPYDTLFSISQFYKPTLVLCGTVFLFVLFFKAVLSCISKSVVPCKILVSVTSRKNM